MIFGENCKNEQIGKSRHRAPMSQHREPTSRRRPMLQRGMPHRGEAEVLKRAPLGYAHGEALLRRGGGLRRDIATIHGRQDFGYLFQKSSIHTPTV